MTVISDTRLDSRASLYRLSPASVMTKVSVLNRCLVPNLSWGLYLHAARHTVPLGCSERHDLSGSSMGPSLSFLVERRLRTATEPRSRRVEDKKTACPTVFMSPEEGIAGSSSSAILTDFPLFRRRQLNAWPAVVLVFW